MRSDVFGVAAFAAGGTWNLFPVGSRDRFLFVAPPSSPGKGRGRLADNEFVAGIEELCRYRLFQVPDDAHGAASLMAYIIGEAKEDVGSRAGQIRIVFADKEQDAAAQFLLVDIALPSR